MNRLLTTLVVLAATISLVGCADNSRWTFGPGGGRAPYESPTPVPTRPVAVASPVATATSAAAPSASPGGAGTISLLEWKVVVASTMKAGPADLTIANQGTIPHELLIFQSDLDPVAYPTDADGNIIEDGGGITLVSDGENVDPAGTQARSVDMTPGKYLFVCNIPTHFKQGMYAVVTVTP